MKEKEDIVQVLAAGIVKMSVNKDKESGANLAGCQINNIPGLFADSEMQPYRKQDKTSLRKCLEKRYPTAFEVPNVPLESSVQERNGMQDLFLAPLKHHIHVKDYFRLFWENKIRRSFSRSSTIVIDFDNQEKSKLLPKDNLHVIRDEKSNDISSDIDVHDEAVIPVVKSSWTMFLANRNNKKSLVFYLCNKMQAENAALNDGEVLFVSFEGKVYKVTSEKTTEIQYLNNNHIESDTRLFLLLTNVDLGKPVSQ